MVCSRLLLVLAGLMVTGCGAIRQEVFALAEQAASDATPNAGERLDAGAIQDAGADAEVVDAALDAGGHTDRDAGGTVDSSVPGCPIGPYFGEFECDFGPNSDLFTGEVWFTIGEMNPITRKANLMDGSARGIVPVSKDDLTPLAYLTPVTISGQVTCIPGAFPQLDVQSAETEFIGIPDLLPPSVVLAISASATDHELFVGRFAVSGGLAEWECAGRIEAGPGTPDMLDPFLPAP